MPQHRLANAIADQQRQLPLLQPTRRAGRLLDNFQLVKLALKSSEPRSSRLHLSNTMLGSLLVGGMSRER